MIKRSVAFSYLLAFLLYLLIAIAITFPLILNLSGQIAGFLHGDGYEMVHHIWWFTHALKTGEPLFTQTLMGYPDGIDGIILWSNPLQFFPAWLIAFVIGAPAAFNLTALITLALNGTSMFALMRYLLPVRQPLGTRHVSSSAAPFVAGVVFMLYPTMQAHLAAGHGGLLVQWTFVLYALALLRLRDGADKSNETTRKRTPSRASLQGVLITAALFVASAWGHTLQILYATLPLTAVVLLAMLWRREWASVRHTVIALILGGLALGIFLLPVASATFGTSAYAEESGVVRYSLDLLAPVTPSFAHPLYSALGYPSRVLGVNVEEGSAYIGLAAGLLAVIGLIRVRAARLWLVLAAVVFVFGLGPLLKVFDQPVTFITDGYASHITLPFAYLANLPVINLARTPGRFAFALALAVAVMAGYGVNVLLSNKRVVGTTPYKVFADHADESVLSSRVSVRYIAITLILTSLIAFDYLSFMPLPTIPIAMPDEIRALRNRTDIRAIFVAPYDHLIVAKAALYLQTGHEHPLIAGQVTRRTPVNPAKLAILEATFDPALLRAAGADMVFIDRGAELGGGEYGSMLYDRAKAILGEPYYENFRAPYYMENWLAVFNVPPTDAEPQFTVVYDDPASLTPSLEPPLAFISDLAIYIYVPQTTGVLLTAALAADNRDVIVRLDDQPEPVAQWTINGSAEASAFVGMEAGYHTLALTLPEPCVTPPSATLFCRPVQVERLTLEAG